jgi:hypothetical protein
VVGMALLARLGYFCLSCLAGGGSWGRGGTGFGGSFWPFSSPGGTILLSSAITPPSHESPSARWSNYASLLGGMLRA